MNKILSPAAAAAPDRSALLHQFADLDSAAQLSFLVAAMLVHGGGPGGTTLKLMCGKFGVHGPADRSTPAGGAREHRRAAVSGVHRLARPAPPDETRPPRAGLLAGRHHGGGGAALGPAAGADPRWDHDGSFLPGARRAAAQAAGKQPRSDGNRSLPMPYGARDFPPSGCPPSSMAECVLHGVTVSFIGDFSCSKSMLPSAPNRGNEVHRGLPEQ